MAVKQGFQQLTKNCLFDVPYTKLSYMFRRLIFVIFLSLMDQDSPWFPTFILGESSLDILLNFCESFGFFILFFTFYQILLLWQVKKFF